MDNVPCMTGCPTAVTPGNVTSVTGCPTAVVLDNFTSLTGYLIALMVQIVTTMTRGFTTVILINVTGLSGCSTADKPFYVVTMDSKGTDSFGDLSQYKIEYQLLNCVCVGGRPVHGTATYRCDDTRDCIIQFCPPGDEHMCSKHVQD